MVTNDKHCFTRIIANRFRADSPPFHGLIHLLGNTKSEKMLTVLKCDVCYACFRKENC